MVVTEVITGVTERITVVTEITMGDTGLVKGLNG
jgi:hypothetical protein